MKLLSLLAYLNFLVFLVLVRELVFSYSPSDAFPFDIIAGLVVSSYCLLMYLLFQNIINKNYAILATGIIISLIPFFVYTIIIISSIRSFDSIYDSLTGTFWILGVTILVIMILVNITVLLKFLKKDKTQA